MAWEQWSGHQFNKDRVHAHRNTSETSPLSTLGALPRQPFIIITKVETLKYFGVTLDSNLTWTSHVDKLHIGVLRRIRPFLDISTAKLVYSATILPILDYCDVVWDNCNVTSTQKLQRLQNRSARIIMGAHFNWATQLGQTWGKKEAAQGQTLV